MAYKNNHFVPQLILRRFGEEISTYNIRTGEYRQGQQTAEVFSKYEFYPLELEMEFGQLEGRFANILNQKILKTENHGEVELTRKELNIVKKFLLLEQMRVFVEEETCSNMSKIISDMHKKTGIFRTSFTHIFHLLSRTTIPQGFLYIQRKSKELSEISMRSPVFQPALEKISQYELLQSCRIAV